MPIYLAIDLETTGLDPHTDTIVDIYASFMDAKPFRVDGVEALREIVFDLTMEYGKEGLIFVGQNFKFDLHMLHRAGLDLLSYAWTDTLLLDHLLDETQPHSLEEMAARYVGKDAGAYKAAFWAKYPTYLDAPPLERETYAKMDVALTVQVFEIQQALLAQESIPDSLLSHVHALASALLQTEVSGVAVDESYLVARGKELQTRIYAALPRMRSLTDGQCELIEMELWVKELAKRKSDRGKSRVARPSFSFSSNPNLQELLYKKLKLPVQKHHKTRKATTDDDALQALKDKHPLIPVLSEWRGWHKIYGAYIEGTLERRRNGRIYPTFNVNGTKTGRISHSNPNLGQLPVQGGIRGIYVPDPGRCLISADYSQLEVVILATLSQDAVLREMLEKGLSQHDITAQALGIPRALAKTLNFAMQYRCSPHKVAALLNQPLPEATATWTRYWETYPGVKRLMDETDRLVTEGKPIVTCFGRKRRFKGVLKGRFLEKAKRQAFNFLVQSTGGDITSQAFYVTAGLMKEMRLGRALWTVHDEIIIEALDERAEIAENVLKSTMIQIGALHGFELKVETSGPMARWED